MTSVVTLGDGAPAWLSRRMPRMSVRRAAGPARGRSARSPTSRATTRGTRTAPRPGTRSALPLMPAMPTPPSWAPAGAFASLGFGVVAAAAAIAVAALAGGTSRTATELAVAAAAPLAVLAGIRLNRPDSRRPWQLLAAALVVLLAASAAGLLADWSADLRLAGYPLLLGALAAVHRARRSGPSWAGLVDSAVVATTAALGYWAFVVELSGADRRSTITQLAFLAGDVLLLALVTRLVVEDVQSTSFALVAAGAGVLVGTDIAVLLTSDPSQETAPVWAHAIWLLSAGLAGTAALHPSMRTVTDATPPREEPGVAMVRLVLLGAVLLLPPLIIAVQALSDDSEDFAVLVVGMVLLMLLVLTRVGLLMRSVALTAERERTLRSAAAAFVAGGDRRGVHAAALDAVDLLLGSTVVVSRIVDLAAVSNEPGDEVVVTAGG